MEKLVEIVTEYKKAGISLRVLLRIVRDLYKQNQEDKHTNTITVIKTASEIIIAVGVIVGVLVKSYQWATKPRENEQDIKAMTKKQEEDIKAIKSEQCMHTYILQIGRAHV